MTAPRSIRLQLAPSTTDMWCGACDITTIDDGKGPAWDCCDHFADMVSHVPGRQGKRLRVCIEAEAAQVELERDAAAWRRVREESGEYSAANVALDADAIIHEHSRVYAGEILQAIAFELRREGVE